MPRKMRIIRSTIMPEKMRIIRSRIMPENIDYETRRNKKTEDYSSNSTSL